MKAHGQDIVWVAAIAALLALVVLVVGWPAAWAGAGASTEPPAVDLRAAPWAAQPDGSPTIEEAPPMPSALFPAGADHEDALLALVDAARDDGALPPGVEPMPPLPVEVVLVRDATADGGLRVSLAAPFGWTADGRRIRPASLSIPGSTPMEEVQEIMDHLRSGTPGLPSGVAVDVPPLDPCQVAIGTPENRPSCE